MPWKTNWTVWSCIRPFAANDHVVQNPSCWRASSLLFLHWDIKQRQVKLHCSLLRKRSYGFVTQSFLPHELLLQPVATSVRANWPITGRLPIFVKRDFDRKFISNFSDFAALFPTLGANSEVQVVGPGNLNDFAALVLTLGANSGSEIIDVRGSIWASRHVVSFRNRLVLTPDPPLS